MCKRNINPSLKAFLRSSLGISCIVFLVHELSLLDIGKPTEKKKLHLCIMDHNKYG